MQTNYLKGTLLNHNSALLPYIQYAGLNWFMFVFPSLPVSPFCMSFLLHRVYRRQNRPEEALRQCEKSLQRLKDCGEPEKTCSVYRDMAAIEQDKGHLDGAIEHLSKARGLSLTQHNILYINTCQAMLLGNVSTPLIWWYVICLISLGVSARLMPLLWVTAQRS